jgi:glyoxylase-like metal-dependent hydrolase (beta-lactamase superfamily II)
MTLDGTNTWVISADGADGVLVVDPGPRIDEHLEAVARHAPVRGVLLTHHHPDHAEGIERFTELTGATVINPAPGGSLRHGDLEITTLATPGHTADSVSFHVDADAPAVFTGDTVLGMGSTAVLWPDGNLGDYLDSLELLERQGPIPVLPGHGPIRDDCAAAAAEYLAHRRQRLDQVRAALRDGASSAADVVSVVYAEVDRSLWPAAESTVRAQLAYLSSRDGEHIRPADGWAES